MKVVIYIVIFAVIAAIGFGVYYFFFMEEPVDLVLPPSTIGKVVSVLDVTLFDNPLYNSLRNYSTLPITPGTAGNPQPFSEIIYIAPPAEEPEPEIIIPIE